MPELSSNFSPDQLATTSASVDLPDEQHSATNQRSDSTLLEFPGLSRAVPEWRKQLSQRVREVQERRAREAAEAAAAAQESEAVTCALPSAQLELVPDLEQPVMNPIVSKALERLERARRSDFAVGNAAIEAAVGPASKIAPPAEEAAQTRAARSRLVVVPAKVEAHELIVPPPQPEIVEAKKKSVRVISDEIEDAALSYLETCLSVPVIASDTRSDRAGVWRRTAAGTLDLLIIAMLAAPFAAGIQLTQPDWANPRVIGLMTGITIVLMFSYLTISIALTGRTLGMRLLSLRTIDVRTGLIPTGGQSVKRAIGYIFSLAILGLGIVFALIDRDGRTMYDRFSKTVVIHN